MGSGTVMNSYWDIGISGTATSAGGTSQTTVGLQWQRLDLRRQLGDDPEDRRYRVRVTYTDAQGYSVSENVEAMRLDIDMDDDGLIEIYSSWSSEVWDFGTSSEYPRLKATDSSTPPPDQRVGLSDLKVLTAGATLQPPFAASTTDYVIDFLANTGEASPASPYSWKPMMLMRRYRYSNKEMLLIILPASVVATKAFLLL